MKEIKWFFKWLWFRILYTLAPGWLQAEISNSFYCPTHKGLSRCNCLEQNMLGSERLKSSSYIWYQKQAQLALQNKIEDLEGALYNAKNSATSWHNAWYDQREATGRAHWKGYADGKRVAISFHMKEASKRRNAANACVTEQDKLHQELDARYHEWSADQIRLSGYDTIKNSHCHACATDETVAIQWKPEGGLRRGEKDR